MLFKFFIFHFFGKYKRNIETTFRTMLWQLSAHISNQIFFLLFNRYLLTFTEIDSFMILFFSLGKIINIESVISLEYDKINFALSYTFLIFLKLSVEFIA